MLYEWRIGFGPVITALLAAGVVFILAAILYRVGGNGDLASRIKILESVILESYVKNQELVLASAQRLENRAASIEERAAIIQAVLEERAAAIAERARLIEDRAKAIAEHSVGLQTALEADHKGLADRADARHTSLEEQLKSLQTLLQQQSAK